MKQQRNRHVDFRFLLFVLYIMEPLMMVSMHGRTSTSFIGTISGLFELYEDCRACMCASEKIENESVKAWIGCLCVGKKQRLARRGKLVGENS